MASYCCGGQQPCASLPALPRRPLPALPPGGQRQLLLRSCGDRQAVRAPRVQLRRRLRRGAGLRPHLRSCVPRRRLPALPAGVRRGLPLRSGGGAAAVQPEGRVPGAARGEVHVAGKGVIQERLRERLAAHGRFAPRLLAPRGRPSSSAARCSQGLPLLVLPFLAVRARVQQAAGLRAPPLRGGGRPRAAGLWAEAFGWQLRCTGNRGPQQRAQERTGHGKQGCSLCPSVPACPQACHAGKCGGCKLAGPKACPCGKTQLPEAACDVVVPPCGETCEPWGLWFGKPLWRAQLLVLRILQAASHWLPRCAAHPLQVASCSAAVCTPAMSGATRGPARWPAARPWCAPASAARPSARCR